jgi:sulfoxide reductase heme-binding subunit YedZ
LKTTPLRVAVHLAAWGLLGWLAWLYYTGHLTINPIQAAEQHTGKYALVFLMLSLACTPLNTVFGLRQAVSVRRSLGLYAFMFAAIHLLIFVGLDYGFNWEFLWADVGTKRYILVGAAAFIILASLALTSFRWWQKKLGKNWKRLHRLVYLAGCLVIVHYAWSKKGDLFRLQGDIIQPLIFGLLVLILLAVRTQPVRRTLVNLRQLVVKRIGKFQSRKISASIPLALKTVLAFQKQPAPQVSSIPRGQQDHEQSR